MTTRKNIHLMEEQIMSCWAVEQELDTLLEYVMEGDCNRDRVANIVLGVKELANLRFDKLFRTYELALKEWYGKE